MSPELVLEKPYDHTADLWFVAGFSSFRYHILLNCRSFNQNTMEVVAVVVIFIVVVVVVVEWW